MKKLLCIFLLLWCCVAAPEGRCGPPAATADARSGINNADVEVLSLGNAYSGTLFNPTALTPTISVTCDTTQFRTAYLRRTPAYADSCLDMTSLTVTAVPTSPRFGIGSDHQHAILWWDLSAIPDDVTIVEAYLCLNIKSANIAMDETQGVYAVLDTLSADAPWTTADIGTCTTQNPNQANTSWTYTDRAAQIPWSPPLATRSATYHWGIRSPLAHGVGGNDGVLETGDNVMIDVKDALQYWVDFHGARDIRQAGWWIGAVRPTTGQISFRITCGTGGVDENLSPSLIVRYQNQPYTGYDWNGHPFVFVFSTDDGHADNLAYKSEFDARGLKYTLFAVGDRLNIARYLTTAQLQSFYADGYDIGNHGSAHVGTSTLPESALGGLVSRGWLAAKLGLTGVDTMQIRSYAYAYGDTANQGGGASQVIARLNEFGYYGARLAGNIMTYSDTPLLWNAPSHAFKVDKWNWNMLADNDDAVADSIRTKLRRVYGMSAYRGGEPIVTVSHGTSTSSYGEMNAAQVGLLLDVIAARGDTWITTFSEMMAWYRDHHTSVDGLIWSNPGPLDQQAPLAPREFTGFYASGGIHLSWLPNEENDLSGYHLYRGDSPDFVPDAQHLIAALAEPGFVDSGVSGGWYKLCAVDVHGNRSDWDILFLNFATGAPATPSACFALHPCAPNPFNPQTTLRFDLPRDGRVALHVYDVRGALVRTLIDAELPRGSHRAVWDGRTESGRDAASGSYFARLEAGGESMTERMSLVR